jgi:cephalosporin-C deacetylase-like acetyl esterase
VTDEQAIACRNWAYAACRFEGAEYSGNVKDRHARSTAEFEIQPMALRSASTLLSLAAAVFSSLTAHADELPAFLPGTTKLELTRPLDELMVDGINRYALRALAESPTSRARLWQRDFSTAAAYEKSIAPNRHHLGTILGVVDPRVAARAFELLATTASGSELARAKSYAVRAVRWHVLPGVTAEGILLDPTSPPRARAVVLPDADWTPESFAGLANGVDRRSQLPRRLVENGVQVVVPTLISRDDQWSGNPAVRFTNQPHREFIYRMAFELGRHIVGYEVQKVLAAVDIFTQMNEGEGRNLPIGVAGIGEGGLLAVDAGALDPRLQAVLVSGYFQPREQLWQEPIYRNVWSLLTEFGDAEIASLIAPRALVIEAAAVPRVTGPPAPRDGRSGAAPGRIETADVQDVRREFARLSDLLPAGFRERIWLVESSSGQGPPGTDSSLARFIDALGIHQPLAPDGETPHVLRIAGDSSELQHRQVDELVDFTQKLLEESAKVRDRKWSQADRSSPAAWAKSAEKYRDLVWRTLIGKLPHPTIPPNVRTRKILEDPTFTGYEVMLDVYPDVIAGGILLLPTDLKPGERRPVVVCQHGLEGVPMDTISATSDGYKYYKGFAAALAQRGFITYAPQNPYRGMDRFRTIQRKSNPLGRSLFSYIIPQHQRTLEWLATLPNVDPDRIGFYGLSYGGKTAVRVPTMLPQYALSICSGDFNEWVRKNATSIDAHSYVFTPEYEMFEWNMGHVANYAELAYLMTPRPFMVERGHDDGVAPDEWVAWEYSKVRRHYDKLGLGDRTEIEFFNGPHTIHGQGTFAFLRKHLNWPARHP